MEWGFLADLLVEEEALGLVDELFIEMHYFHPAAWCAFLVLAQC